MGFWFWRRSWWVRAEVISWVSGSGEGVGGLELRLDLGFLVSGEGVGGLELRLDLGFLVLEKELVG